MRTRTVTVLLTALAVLVLGAGTSSAAQTAGLAAPRTGHATATLAHLIASGPGWTLVGSGAPSTGQARARPQTLTSCGWVTCSLYLSRAQTRWLNYNIALAGGGVTGLGAFCGLMALVSNVAAVFVGVGCVAVVAVYGGFIVNAITHAAADNGCFRIRYPALAFYDDHSSFCHNT